MTALWGIAVFVIISTRYIEIRQQFVIADQRSINQYLKHIQARKVVKIKPFSLWLKYMRLNKRTVHICDDIRAYSRYWSPYLSLIFPTHIFMSSYTLYAIFLNQTVPMIHKYFFFMVGCFIFLFLYLLTNRCALVLKNNGKIQAENRRFYLAFQFFANFCLHQQIKVNYA